MSTPHTLGRRQLYMLPTRYGLGFALMLLVLLLGSVNYNNGLGHALTFTLASVALVSMLYTQRNLLGLEVEAGACAPVFAGDDARLTVCLRNGAPYARLGVVVEQRKRGAAPVDLAPGGRGCVALALPTQRRGWLDCPPVVVATYYPLGLVRGWSRRVPLAARCLVYPRPAAAPPLPLGEGGGNAARAAPAGTGSDDFAGLREYHYGDSPRHVHWKAVARGGAWVTKQFAGEHAGIVWLDWAALEGHDTETRVSILCRWVLDAEDGGWRYGLRLPSLTLPPAAGAAHRHACLQALALFET